MEGSMSREGTSSRRFSSVIYPYYDGKIYRAYLYAICWNLVVLLWVWPMHSQLAAEMAAENYGFLLIYVLPVMGVFFVVRCIRLTLHYFSFAKVPLLVSPFPVVIGERMKGELQFEQSFSPETRFTVCLNCLRTEERRDGEGDMIPRTKTVWSATQEQTAVSMAGASRVCFAFDVPANLPATQAPLLSWHHWELMVNGFVGNVAVLRLTYAIKVCSAHEV